MESIAQMVDAYSHGYVELEEAIKDIPSDLWTFRPSTDSWTIHEVIIHLADMEANGYIRLLKALAEPGGGIMPVDQNAWTANLLYDQQDRNVALELYKWLRIKNYLLLKNLPEKRWSDYMNHPEAGPITVAKWLDNYVDHGKRHIRQIERIRNQYMELQITALRSGE